MPKASPRSRVFRCSLRQERRLHKAGVEIVVGIDEAGRGPLAGPVVAAAVVLPRGFRSAVLTDSKALSPATREALYTGLTGLPAAEAFPWEQAIAGGADGGEEAGVYAPKTGEKSTRALAWAVALAGSGEIDRINILRATHAAMRRAVVALQRVAFTESVCWHALIDGLAVHPFPLPQTALVRGDALSFSIAAASVLAKVTRDRILRAMDRLYPAYGFGKHKGYGTAGHLAALLEHGPCPLHRRSFLPVREAQMEFASVG